MLDQFRGFDQFKDYFEDLEQQLERIIRSIRNMNWGKFGDYV